MEVNNNCDKARAQIRKWFNPISLVPKSLRFMLVGLITTVTFGEVYLYKMIQSDIRAGQLPQHIVDTLIVVGAILETILAPVLSWWGYRSRRKVLIIWVVLTTMCFISWFTLPNYSIIIESEFCDDNENTKGFHPMDVSMAYVIRLTMVLISGIVFMLARVGIWSHGLAYLEEHDPDHIASHFGFVLSNRVIPLLIGKHIVIVENNTYFQCTIFVIGMIVHFLQLHMYIPKNTPHVDGLLKMDSPTSDRGFFVSVGRVTGNLIAMSQMVSIGFMAASLWGYAFYRTDIIKTQFLIDPERSTSSHIVQPIQFLFTTLIIAFAGMHFSAPILPAFCNLKAIKRASIMSILTIIVYVVLMIATKCNTGEIAGLVGSYSTPSCSLQCGCQSSWPDYSPVCMVDEQVTYLSPCQAGCSRIDNVNGISMYANCTCGYGRAVAGACSNTTCQYALDLHNILFLLLVTFTILALQAQGVLLLKTVDARDKSVALGIAWSAVAIIVYMFSHSYFVYIKSSSCSWLDGGVCHLYSRDWPTLVGVACAVLAAISALLNISSFVCIRNSKRHNL